MDKTKKCLTILVPIPLGSPYKNPQKNQLAALSPYFQERKAPSPTLLDTPTEEQPYSPPWDLCSAPATPRSYDADNDVGADEKPSPHTSPQPKSSVQKSGEIITSVEDVHFEKNKILIIQCIEKLNVFLDTLVYHKKTGFPTDIKKVKNIIEKTQELENYVENLCRTYSQFQHKNTKIAQWQKIIQIVYNCNNKIFQRTAFLNNKVPFKVINLQNIVEKYQIQQDIQPSLTVTLIQEHCRVLFYQLERSEIDDFFMASQELNKIIKRLVYLKIDSRHFSCVLKMLNDMNSKHFIKLGLNLNYLPLLQNIPIILSFKADRFIPHLIHSTQYNKSKVHSPKFHIQKLFQSLSLQEVEKVIESVHNYNEKIHNNELTQDENSLKLLVDIKKIMTNLPDVYEKMSDLHKKKIDLTYYILKHHEIHKNEMNEYKKVRFVQKLNASVQFLAQKPDPYNKIILDIIFKINVDNLFPIEVGVNVAPLLEKEVLKKCELDEKKLEVIQMDLSHFYFSQNDDFKKANETSDEDEIEKWTACYFSHLLNTLCATKANTDESVKRSVIQTFSNLIILIIYMRTYYTQYENLNLIKHMYPNFNFTLPYTRDDDAKLILSEIFFVKLAQKLRDELTKLNLSCADFLNLTAEQKGTLQGIFGEQDSVLKLLE